MIDWMLESHQRPGFVTARWTVVAFVVLRFVRKSSSPRISLTSLVVIMELVRGPHVSSLPMYAHGVVWSS